MMLFDCHCHLQDERLAPGLDAVVERAREAGVEGVVCCGTSEGDWGQVSELAERWKGWVVPSYGVHPWYVRERSEAWLEALRERLESEPAAVGEIGLDFVVAGDAEARAEQEAVFLAQWRLSVELGRPVSIHCRKAFRSLVWLLRGEGAHPAGFLVHSYSGGPENVKALTKLGGYFSFGGSLTRSGNRRGPRAVAAIGAERLLAETDAPDLPPVIDGELVELSEPGHVVHPVRRLGELTTCGEEAMAEQLWANSRRLFGPVWPGATA